MPTSHVEVTAVSPWVRHCPGAGKSEHVSPAGSPPGAPPLSLSGSQSSCKGATGPYTICSFPLPLFPFSAPSSPPTTAVFLLQTHGAHSCLGAWPLCCVAGVSFPRGQSALTLSSPRVLTQWVFPRPPYLRLDFSLPGSLYLLFLLSFYPENFIFYHCISFSHLFVWRLTYPVTISLMWQELCITHCFEQLLLRLLNE